MKAVSNQIALGKNWRRTVIATLIASVAIPDILTKIYEMLDQCRAIIIGNKPGANVLRYLLHKMNNRVIKWQLWNQRYDGLSGLYLHYGCKPFDEMPYCSSPRQHNPRIYDLFESIPVSGHEHELFARYIKNNTEIEGHLFTPKAEIEGFEDIDGLIALPFAS